MTSRTLLMAPDDDYGNAPEMSPRPIKDALTTAEIENIAQQLRAALLLVEAGVRIPDDLVLALGTFERRFFATADEARCYAAVVAAHKDGRPLARGCNLSAFDVAAEAVGCSASTAERIYYSIQNMTRKPLASTPKRRRKKSP